MRTIFLAFLMFILLTLPVCDNDSQDEKNDDVATLDGGDDDDQTPSDDDDTSDANDGVCDLGDYCRFVLDQCPVNWSGWYEPHDSVADCVDYYEELLATDPNCQAAAFINCVCSNMEDAVTCDETTFQTEYACFQKASGF